MPVVEFFPIPVIVSLIAFLWMVFSAYFKILAWVAFLTWGAYFLTAINTKSVVREGISFSLGILFGMGIAVLGTAWTATMGQFAFPAAVAVAAFVIIFLELVPWFDMAPGYFIGCAAFFAAGAKPDLATLIAVLVPGLLGLALGILTAYLRGLIFSIEGKQDPLRQQAKET